MTIDAFLVCNGACRLAHGTLAASGAVEGSGGGAGRVSGAALALGSWPDWLQVALMLVAVGIGAAMVRALVSLRDRFPEPEKSDAVAFVTMLCAQVWESTDRITSVFAERLRQPPGDIAQLRILVRHLREDMSIPVNFIEQMRAHPPGEWQGAAIFKAFNNWSAQVAAMAKQLDDLHHQITYPLLREPVDKQRDAMLVYHYHTEQAFLDRRIDDVLGRAHEFCAVARKILAKRKKRSGTGGQAEDEPHDCPCCNRAPGQHRHNARDPLKPIVLPPPPAPPPPPPPPPPAPVPAACCCTAPRACHCRRGCACACQCPPAPAAKTAG